MYDDVELLWPTCSLHGRMKLIAGDNRRVLWECQTCGSVDELAQLPAGPAAPQTLMVDECLDEIKRLMAANERLTRLVQTNRPELHGLRRLASMVRDASNNWPGSLELMVEQADQLLGGHDDLPSTEEVGGILSDGKARVDEAVAELSRASSPSPSAQQSNGVDLRVIQEAYAWTIDVDGEVAGLTDGDHHFERTGIKIPLADLRAFSEPASSPSAALRELVEQWRRQIAVERETAVSQPKREAELLEHSADTLELCAQEVLEILGSTESP